MPGHLGRQLWVYDPDGATSADTAEVERIRSQFTSNRCFQRHSADELIRVQYGALRKKRAREIHTSPPPPSAYDTSVRSVSVTEDPIPRSVIERSMRAGVEFYQGLQDEDGHWASDYGGPLFLLPGLIIALYVMGQLDDVLPDYVQVEMRRYLLNHQNEDGGFGLHIEGSSTMFGTTLSYVSMRLLGMTATTEAVVNARSWILSRGGAINVPSWGKFYLCILGIYDWEGLNPVPPECWLLPYEYNPIHPGRFWCHCRMVYLPMSYLYGCRASGASSFLTEELKSELFVGNYKTINWDKTRNTCASEDLYYSHPRIQDALWWGLTKVEPFFLRWWPGRWIRANALKLTMNHIHYEDENTRYINIGPVNKVMNMLSCWFQDPSEFGSWRKHTPRVADYLWLAEDGMKMAGYNGSQLWDCAFAVQAIVATGLHVEYSACLRSAHKYIRDSQVLDDCPGQLSRRFRHISKGAWPFSTRDHGWPISDCSSEGLKAALELEAMGSERAGPSVPVGLLQECVNVILSYQNMGGGWATYENTRSYEWVEIINPAETFGDIMIDYPYVECSSASMQALAKFHQRYPTYRKQDIKKSLHRGRKFLLSIQRRDGSWYGSWAICFTYGTWFGIKGLMSTGSTFETCEALRRAVKFLLSKQMPCGGWGESYLSSQTKQYVQLEGGVSHVVNTAWAMLALLASGQISRDPLPLHRGARSLMRAQCSNGDWPQQTIMGVFNNNCMITYANYRNIFPLWALGEYTNYVYGFRPSEGQKNVYFEGITAGARVSNTSDED
jgi:cycloartenol synthase